MRQRGYEISVPAVYTDLDEVIGMIYTSGTLGNPKGVLLSNRNYLYVIQEAVKMLPFQIGDVTLSFLPWAHIFGQGAEVHITLLQGFKTALVQDVNKLITELSIIRPTLFFSVPRVYNQIYERIHGQMLRKPKVIQWLFYQGLKISGKQKEGQRLHLVDKAVFAVADRLIFGKIRTRFGGNLRLAFSGGSALSPEVAKFINNLGIELYEGYGLSETTALTAVNSPENHKYGTVGQLLPGTTVKIDTGVIDAEQKGGEIIVYGPTIMKGYHNLPVLNQEVFTSDGGFRTGDIGHVDEEGFLQITGRIKEIYKLENGKYIAPAPMEENMKLSTYINQILIYGENRPYNVAVIVVVEDNLQEYAKNQGWKLRGDALLQEKGIQDLIRKEIRQYGKQFPNYELPKKFLLLNDDWTIENGLITPTLKVKRKVVEKKFHQQIEQMYLNLRN